MNDRFMNGFTAGVLAGMTASLVDLILVSWLKFGSIRFLDFSGVFIYGGKPLNLPEALFAQFGELVWDGFIGILFVYFITDIRSRYLLIKGAVYGLIVWFITYALVILYRVPAFKKIALESAMENAFVSMLYGFVLATAVLYLQRRERLK